MVITLPSIENVPAGTIASAGKTMNKVGRLDIFLCQLRTSQIPVSFQGRVASNQSLARYLYISACTSLYRYGTRCRADLCYNRLSFGECSKLEL